MHIVPWIVAALNLAGKGATGHGATPAVPGLPGGKVLWVKICTVYIYVLLFDAGTHYEAGAAAPRDKARADALQRVRRKGTRRTKFELF